MSPMNRREAIKSATALLGGVLVTSVALPACSPSDTRQAANTPNARAMALSAEDQTLIEEIADTLLPTTSASPGAKAAGAGATINLLLTECYEPAPRERVVRGLREFRETCRTRCGAGFASLPQPAREEFLREIDAAAKRAPDTHYFELVRELALRAYFSSEIGMTQALRYVRVPGRWEGCVTRTPGQPAWA